MSAHRPRRPGRRTATVEELLREARVHGQVGTDALAAILAAAAAPGRESELSGESAALAAFRTSHEAAGAQEAEGAHDTADGGAAAPSTPVPSRPGRWRPGGGTWRRPSVGIGAGALAVACATALAALFLGVFSDGPQPQSPPATGRTPTSQPAPLMASSGADSGGAPGPSVATTPSALLVPCHVYLDSDGTPASLNPRVLVQLAQAAGGSQRIKQYCQAALATQSPPPSGR